MGQINEEYLKLQRAVEYSDEAIFITDLDGIITYVNMGFTRLYGHLPEDIIGKVTPRILKSGEMRSEDYYSFWQSIMKKEVVRGEFINKAKDGRLLNVRGSANPILNNEGDLIGFIGIQYDISSQKKTEKALKISEEKFRKAFLISPDAVNISRLSDGVFVSVNEGFSKIIGYTEAEVIGRSSFDLDIWCDKEKRTQLVKLIQERGTVENFEICYRHKNGNQLNCLLSASLLDIDGVSHLLSVIKDITGSKKTENALLQEQFLMNALMNNLPDHIYFKDKESRFIRNSKSHAVSFGLSDPDMLIGKSDFDFFAEDAARQAYNDEQNMIASGEPVIKEERLVRKDNSVAWFSAMKMPLFDNSGNIVGTFGISRDITKRKKAEEELKHSEERFRAVTESANEAIISANQKGIIIGWNKGAEEAFGYMAQEILGMSLKTIIPEDFIRLVVKSTKRLELWAVNNVVGKTIEVIGLKKDGTVFPLEMSLAEWQASEGKFYTGILRDITRRKRTELENSINYEIAQGITTTSNLDELLKLIHNSLIQIMYAENIFVALHDKKTGLFNFPYFVDKIDSKPEPVAMGKSCSAYVFRTVRPFLYSDEIFNQLVEQNEVELVGYPSPSWVGIPLQTPSEVIGVLVLQHYEKENVYNEEDVNFLVSVGHQIAISIERKRGEEEIKLKNELLQSINAEKDKFFSIIAHDLRGPLSAFVSATQILTEEIQSMSLEEIKQITGSMKASASNIYNLLENLLEWSRLKRGGIDYVPVKLNLKNKIEECTDVLSEFAGKKQIEISVAIDPGIIIMADNHMFDSIIRNLVSNAIKFTKPGGTIKILAAVKTDRTREIKIIDSGIGMTPELKNKLFVISEKTSRFGTEGETSTGLGLLLCKEFVEKHGGTIRVESEVGKGSTFCFTIPEF